jgi:hypothetical protein
MMLRKSFLGAAGLLTVAGALSFHGCSSDEGHQHESEQDSSEATGSVGMSLTLPSGLTINSVQYTITGTGGFSRSQTVDVTNSSVLRFRVGNLPAGSYTMNLVGTGPAAATNCAGSAPFTISNNTNTDLMMTLQCGGGSSTDSDNNGDVIVNGEVVSAPSVSGPVVTGISALPLESLSGGGMALEASVSSTADATFAWTGTGGAFSAANAQATNFTCAAGTGADRTLTFSVSKSGCEARSQTVTVSCSTRVFSSQTSYLVPVASGVTTQAILTAGDQVGFKPDGTTPYRMVGIPDGLGVFDNDDGTFTLLSNHELASGGVPRAHGGDGSFVSKWTIRKSDLGVTKGQDLIQTVQLWNSGTSAYAPAANFAFSRFCSADLAPVSAWYANGTGFNGQLFLNGEETGNEGRPMAHGMDGTSWELPRLGNASWENLLASPFAQAKTIVVGTDDSTPGQVYVYVGTKSNSGSNVDKAGLTNGTLYGVAVTSFPTEPSATGIPTGPFTLASLGNVENMTGATIDANSTAANVTRFNRPEDGAWDPAHPSDFYFVTTNSFSAPSRLWRLRFTDITQPELGGTVEMMLDGTEGQIMLDNIGIDARGHIMLVEDVGNNAHIGQVFRCDIATDTLTNIAQHDPNRFVTGASMFLTQDEEASGIVDATAVLGAGWWLVDVQAHYGISGELYEGGQYVALYDPGSL